MRRFVFAPARFLWRDGGMFWLKKLISSFLMPLSIVLLAGGAGLALAFTSRRRRAGLALGALAFLILAAGSNNGLSRRLIDPLETRYPAVGEMAPDQPLPPALAACRHIVVLGSGNGNREALSALDRLSSGGKARLTEALRLSRLLPHADILFSGPTFTPGEPTNARVMADAAVSLGLDRRRIALLEDARDTEEETVRIKALLGDADFVLITSAWHMPRAMALARKLGLHALPCPTDYLDTERSGWGWDDLAWNSDALQRTTAAVHERLGLLWSWLRGRI